MGKCRSSQLKSCRFPTTPQMPVSSTAQHWTDNSADKYLWINWNSKLVMSEVQKRIILCSEKDSILRRKLCLLNLPKESIFMWIFSFLIKMIKSPYDRRGLEAFQRDTIPYGLEIRDGRENILPSAVWKQTDLGLNASSVTSQPSDPG